MSAAGEQHICNSLTDEWFPDTHPPTTLSFWKQPILLLAHPHLAEGETQMILTKVLIPRTRQGSYYTLN